MHNAVGGGIEPQGLLTLVSLSKRTLSPDKITYCIANFILPFIDYLFLDLTQYCSPNDTTCIGVLERLVDAGLLLTPGGAFGEHFQKWARLCFTSVPKQELERALECLNEVLVSS